MTSPAFAQGITANRISLLLGHPDPATLNTPQFQEVVSRFMSSPGAFHALEYGNEQGNVELIDYLAAKISREQGVTVGADNVMITAGSTGAVDMVARLYARPGTAVIVEAPTYVDSLQVFRDHGAELYGVAMDQDGVIVAAFEMLLRQLAQQNQPILFYTIPTFHNPTGITTSEVRRRDILRLARQYDVLIVEDDVYRDLAFDSAAPSSYYILAEGVNVIQVGSFSKILAPGLRLGWAIAAADVVQRFVFCGATQMSGGASPFSAQIVAEYCQQGYLDAHIEQLRGVYRTRRDTLLTALDSYMPPNVSWTKPAGGFFVWVTLPDGVQGVVIKAQALERGVMLAAGSGFFINPDDGKHNFRLTYSFAPLPDLEAGARILGEVIAGES